MNDADKPVRKRPPATTIEARENQMIALAVDLAESQLRDGSASSQVITHYLKLGTTRERLEQDNLRKSGRLTDAKISSIESSAHSEEMYEQAIAAMKSYSMGGGNDAPDPDF